MSAPAICAYCPVIAIGTCQSCLKPMCWSHKTSLHGGFNADPTLCVACMSARNASTVLDLVREPDPDEFTTRCEALIRRGDAKRIRLEQVGVNAETRTWRRTWVPDAQKSWPLRPLPGDGFRVRDVQPPYPHRHQGKKTRSTWVIREVTFYGWDLGSSTSDQRVGPDTWTAYREHFYLTDHRVVIRASEGNDGRKKLSAAWPLERLPKDWRGS